LTKLGKYKGVRVVTIYGGASYRTQIEGVKRGAHIIVATPGRLVDFISQKMAKLDKVQTVVLDEADEMISMGFKDDLETILKATHSGANTSGRAACKTWLFSATMSAEIRRVADIYLEKPQIVAINKVGGGVSDTVEQVYYTVKNSNKTEVIGRILQTIPNFYGLIFCQTKLEVVELTDNLNRRGFTSDSLHGDRSQREREVTLKNFRNREVQVVVATDVAARGLDVKDLTHVINYNLPWDTESYIHRIGRTARNGQKGVAISLVNPEQLRSLRRIMNQTKVAMSKGKIPTGDDVAKLKALEVYQNLNLLKADSQLLKRAIQLVKDQEFDLTAMSPEETIARVVAAYYPEVFSVKNDAMLDYVGDRIPQELMPGAGSSRPPVGGNSRGGYDRRREGGGGGGYRNDRGGGGGGYRGRSGGGDRDYSPRGAGGDSPRGGGEDRPPRREFVDHLARRDDRGGAPFRGNDAPPARRKNENGADFDSRPRRDFAPRGEDSGPRKAYAPHGSAAAAPRRDYSPGARADAPRGAGGSSDAPRRAYAPRTDGDAPRKEYGGPRRESGGDSSPRREFSSRPPLARREDPKGVVRHRPYKRKED
jgi:ATP-dependent RNA helicase DeaD